MLCPTTLPRIDVAVTNPIWVRLQASGQAGELPSGPHPQLSGPFHEPPAIRLQLPAPFEE